MTGAAFSGVNLAIMTPFDARGAIDFARFDALIEMYLEAGVSGFVLSSGTGMHVYLSEAESAELIARGCRRIDGRARVIAQSSALITAEVVRRTRHAADCGADAVMVLPPFFEGPTDDDGVLAFYEEVCAAGLPVIGYNVPDAVGVTVTPELFARLGALPGFHALKDSAGDQIAQDALIRTARTTDADVLNGTDPLALHALFAGAGGLIWGGANFAPRSCVALAAAADAGDWEAAKTIWDRLAPAMTAIWGPDYVPSVYAAAQHMGYGAGTPRAPLRALDETKLAPLIAALDALEGDHGRAA